MPLFRQQVEVSQSQCVKVPMGWALLIHRLNSQEIDAHFNIDGAFKWFDGSEAELKIIAQKALKSRLKAAKRLGRTMPVGCEADMRAEALGWFNNPHFE